MGPLTKFEPGRCTRSGQRDRAKQACPKNIFPSKQFRSPGNPGANPDGMIMAKQEMPPLFAD